MSRRMLFTVAGASILVGAGIGAYLWFGGADDAGNAQSTLDLINKKLALNGEPTLPPGTALGQPPTGSAREVATATPGSSPTPQPPSCGEGAISGGQEIVNAYGEVRNCGVYGTQLVFTTVGTTTEPGGIGTFQCASEDDACLHMRAPRAAGAWSFFPAPRGGVKILAFVPPDILVISGDQGCFNLSTHQYAPSTTCQ